MAPSRNRKLWRALDRAALAGIAAGIAMLVQPWWAGGFRIGFFVTLAATVFHIVTSHVAAEADRL